MVKHQAERHWLLCGSNLGLLKGIINEVFLGNNMQKRLKGQPLISEETCFIKMHRLLLLRGSHFYSNDYIIILGGKQCTDYAQPQMCGLTLSTLETFVNFWTALSSSIWVSCSYEWPYMNYEFQKIKADTFSFICNNSKEKNIYLSGLISISDLWKDYRLHLVLARWESLQC